MTTMTTKQQFKLAFRVLREQYNPKNDGHSQACYSSEYRDLPYNITRAAYSTMCLRSRLYVPLSATEKLEAQRQRRAWMELFSHG